MFQFLVSEHEQDYANKISNQLKRIFSGKYKIKLCIGASVKLISERNATRMTAIVGSYST